MSKKLHNSLIDYLIVVGCDKDSGLTFIDNQSLDEENLDKITNVPVEPSILSVISCDLANYPESPNKISINYPPLKLIRDVSFDLGDSEPSAKAKREAFNRRATIKPFESPIQSDILQNLPQFCFPNKAYVSKLNVDPFIHSFVLTDIEGRKKYSVVLTYYREFFCSKNEKDDVFELLDVNCEDEAEENRNYFRVYVPTSIVIISRYSYLTVLKECLSSIYNSLMDENENFQSIIENYSFYLTHLPVPPKSFDRFNLILEANISSDRIISIHPQDEYEFEVFDLNLLILFNRMKLDNILKVILCCLCESKMVFISKNYGLLTPFLQCLLKLLQPFKWMLAYVPLLPGSQLGYIEAPHPFIMGYCSDFKSLLSELDQDNELTIIDIDQDEIYCKYELIDFPTNYLNSFKTKFSKVDLNYMETQKLIRPSKLDLNSQERIEVKLRNELNSNICDVFVEFYVEIFGDLTQFVKKQSKKFNKQSYMDSISEADLPFYKQILDSSLFEIFTLEFIKNLNDEKPDLYYKKLLELKSNIENPEGQSLRLRSNSSVGFGKQIIKVLKLPTECSKIIDELSNELETSNLLPYKDSLHYLKGFFYILINQVKDGFKELYLIDSKKLFPKETIREYIFPSLTMTQIEIIKEQKFYNTAPDFKKIYDEDNESRHHFLVSLNSMDVLLNEYECLEDLSFDEFVNKLDQLEIRIDLDTTDRLFKALTLDNCSKLDRSTFEIFIDSYQSKENELKKINKFLPFNKLRSIEFAIKVSVYTVVPSYGIGLLVLTQRCIYFLEQGTNKRKVLTELKDIISIEKIQYNKGFFQSKPALKINTMNQIVYICPDGEINVWYILLNEMCSSIRISNETKDSSLIQFAAINVLLLDSVLQSGLNPTACHSEDLEKSIKFLCFYSLYKSDNSRLRMSADAKKILHLRINPSTREYTNQSVESMIYVDIENYPTVWCAIGNRIKIFDAITWNDEIIDIKLEAKITCLLHEPVHSKVWISTLDGYFYVMDVLTRTFDRRIQDHTDVIICIVIFRKIEKVISASANGDIFVWNPETLEKTDTFNHKISDTNRKSMNEIITSKDYLMITSSSQIDVLDERLQLKETLKFKIGETYEKISCCCVSYDKESDEEFLWVGNSLNGIVTVWSLKNFELKMRIGVEERDGYRSFLCVDDFIWAGSKDGRLMLFCSKNFECEKSFKAHNDTVRSLCYVENNKFVVSGSGSRDGSIAVWRASRINKKSLAGSIGKLLSAH